MATRADQIMSPMADEPGWGTISIPVATSSIVKDRWQHYLQTVAKTTPDDFGETTWDDVVSETD